MEFPELLVGERMLIQVLVLLTVHVQRLLVVTLTVLVSAPEP